jgi:hypothetical protein
MTKAPIKLTLDQVDNDLERLFRVQETADHLAYGREDLLQAISGPIGELWAARLLLTLGYIVFKMPKSAQKIDLKIMLPGGDYLPIQVKSLQAKKGAIPRAQTGLRFKHIVHFRLCRNGGMSMGDSPPRDSYP